MEAKERFVHRDLSWLAFNSRVLEEACDLANPLLERIRFCAIFVNNLDEFYMVRVAGLKRLLDSEYNRRDDYGYFPQEVYSEIKMKTDYYVKKLYTLYEQDLKPMLAKEKIRMLKYAELNAEQKKYSRDYFENVIYPVVTPLAVDQGHPFPVLPSKTKAFAVNLKQGAVDYLALVILPAALPRLIKLPSDSNAFDFILLEDILRENLSLFFRGYDLTGYGLFRVLRDSELEANEEYSSHLLKAIESELRKRPKAKVVYLEAEENCQPELLDQVCAGLDFPRADIILHNGLDLTYLFDLASQATKPGLVYPSFIPQRLEYADIFEKIKEGDFLIHLPYQSYQPTVDLLQASAKDPQVLAIKMTMYRTNKGSALVAALKEAAKRGKQVTVLVEIKARFDEENNINWAKELEDAGCHVIYGIAGLKIHSKMTMIVRREEDRIKRYVHLSTGNYNEKTAKVYTDLGYFTANDDFARDISDIFNVITGYSLPGRWKRLISSPHDLRKYFSDLIEEEIENQKKNKNGLIIAKMNSLEDPAMIEKLYEASKAGVKVRLIIRGICCLIPGIKGLSENIEVKSIVGRFLEHTRIYLFGSVEPRIFLSSADWMRRNLDRRIELMFEITKPELRAELQNILDVSWKDDIKGRQMQNDKTYKSKKSGKFNAQDFLIGYYAR